MRRLILISVIVIGLGIIAAAGYFLIFNPPAPAPVIVKPEECVVEVDVPSVTWPTGYDAAHRDLINREIEQAVAGLLVRHLPPSMASLETIRSSQDALVGWCQNNYQGSTRYSVDVNAKVTQNENGILSLQIVDKFKAGGAPAGTRSAGLIFDTINGKRLDLADLVKPGKLAAFAVIEHKKILGAGASYIYESTKREIDAFLAKPTEAAARDWYATHGHATVTPESVVILYDPGDIGRSTPDGILMIKVPRSELVGIIE